MGKKYQEQGLQYIDPVVLTARNRLTPFAWDEQIMADAGLHFPELFEQAREFGVTHGYTFVLHDYNDNLVTLSFAFNVEQRAEAIQALTDRKGDISVLLASIHESYLALSPLSEKMPHPWSVTPALPTEKTKSSIGPAWVKPTRKRR